MLSLSSSGKQDENVATVHGNGGSRRSTWMGPAGVYGQWRIHLRGVRGLEHWLARRTFSTIWILLSLFAFIVNFVFKIATCTYFYAFETHYLLLKYYIKCS